jgi:photosystem II Psb27 protein
MPRALVALGLCLCLTLGACSGASGGLSGNYVDDTVSVAKTLLTTIAIPQDDPSHPQAETEARQLITAYLARYRSRRDVNGLNSFTTMQTAINSLAGHYVNYANRPLPDALRSRLEKELQRAATGVTRGA